MAMSLPHFAMTRKMAFSVKPHFKTTFPTQNQTPICPPRIAITAWYGLIMCRTLNYRESWHLLVCHSLKWTQSEEWEKSVSRTEITRWGSHARISVSSTEFCAIDRVLCHRPSFVPSTEFCVIDRVLCMAEFCVSVDWWKTVFMTCEIK